MDAIERLREICLAFPEATERETWGEQTFRVREKIFAMAGTGSGRWRMSCKARRGMQAALIGSDSERFFVPPYVGPKGWIGIELEAGPDGAGPDWDEVADLIEESYRMTAPKRLAAQLDG
jgi:predicted DNA-binding protein (MmcQ/YjbR family)